MNRKKYINTFSRNDTNRKKRKVAYSVNKKVADSVKNENRTLIISFSNCSKTYLMNFFLLQKKNGFL